MVNSELGERMKRYEVTTQNILLQNSFAVLRVDGRAFHTFTKNMLKPFDYKLMECMVRAGEATAKEMSGFKLGYHQSDEFTFAISDTDSFESEFWFGGNIQKLCSITASLFTSNFNYEMGGTRAVFDCRVFNVPIDDIANVFFWRQQDWQRNSLQMLARSVFSQKQLNNKNTAEIHDMLYEKGINWAARLDNEKNGTFITSNHDRICEKLMYDEINVFLGIDSW
jgi:tRNA(His) guanylyltransferase